MNTTLFYPVLFLRLTNDIHRELNRLTSAFSCRQCVKIRFNFTADDAAAISPDDAPLNCRNRPALRILQRRRLSGLFRCAALLLAIMPYRRLARAIPASPVGLSRGVMTRRKLVTRADNRLS